MKTLYSVWIKIDSVTMTVWAARNQLFLCVQEDDLKWVEENIPSSAADA